MLDNYIGLDFETYAATDLTKHGLDQYVNCPRFQPLIAAVAYGDGSTRVFDFTFEEAWYEAEVEEFTRAIEGYGIVAHNAGFEKAVIDKMGIHIPISRFIDSAVVARAAGAAGKLEAAAPQLLNKDKLESGWPLIKKFSIPGKYQEENLSLAFDPKVISDNPDDWAEFMRYCVIDAELSRLLANRFMLGIGVREARYNQLTMKMNQVGWNVDMDLVEEMQRRYLLNCANEEVRFRAWAGEPDLNLNSHPQLKEWCAKRGVRAKSFDEANVARMVKQLIKKLDGGTTTTKKWDDYNEVFEMLRTKQVLGGSSLKKLQTLIDTVGEDNRLRDSYLHVGAGASYRTSGRGVQMQNLKRLNGQGDVMEDLYDERVAWNNSRLATNLRQVFCSSDPLGKIIVGDFASVENRGLAWQAGEQWKLDAFNRDEDLYKVFASKIFDKQAVDIMKSERMLGKVGELSCGYGAGADAVKDFAIKMGVELSEGESAKLVKDWREANPSIVQYWYELDDAMKRALATNTAQHVAMDQGYVRIAPVPAPASLCQQTGTPQLRSFVIKMFLSDEELLFTRTIHGVHVVGRGLRYWKPSERKTGDLWNDTFTDPKTKQTKPYTIWGGKLAGILTQSLCRELFFDSMVAFDTWSESKPNVQMVGQFHDEIVVDWQPMASEPSLRETMDNMQVCMSKSRLPGFPLKAEINAEYRYTK